MWTQTRPTVEGWYFWKQRRDTWHEFRFHAYYVLDDSSCIETEDDFSCWTDGTAVNWPKGGWWFAIYAGASS